MKSHIKAVSRGNRTCRLRSAEFGRFAFDNRIWFSRNKVGFCSEPDRTETEGTLTDSCACFGPLRSSEPRGFLIEKLPRNRDRASWNGHDRAKFFIIGETRAIAGESRRISCHLQEGLAGRFAVAGANSGPRRGMMKTTSFRKEAMPNV